MSAHGFKSVFLVASVAGAALGCYLVSLNVASERAKLESVESKIVLAQRDIRVLQTEIGTRGRLAQLERWNVGFIRLSAPSADQFLEGGFQLATMVKPDAKPVIEAPVVLASAPAGQTIAQRPGTNDGDEARPVGAVRTLAPSASDMMRVASYSRPPVAPKAMPVTTARPKPSVAKSAAAKPPAANGTKVAAADALAPLPTGKSAAKATTPGGASATTTASRKTKDFGAQR
ncbi:MAG: hypothetical protein ABI617_04380 [Sphingomicrobium sp.]